jgi:anti-sigma B factor antagonist
MITYEVEADTFTLCISGELNINTLPGIRAKVESLDIDKYTDVVIDLNKVDFLDSSGMGYLVVLIKNVKGRGASISLRDPSPGVRRMLAAIRIDRYVRIIDADGNLLNQTDLEEPEGASA